MAKSKSAAKSSAKSKTSSGQSKKSSAVPQTFKDFIAKYPALGESHERIAKAVDKAGPLDEKTRALIKIGICIGAGLDSAMRSHVRRAMQAGVSEKEIEQAVLLAMNTCGLPRTVAAWSWAQQQFARGV